MRRDRRKEEARGGLGQDDDGARRGAEVSIFLNFLEKQHCVHVVVTFLWQCCFWNFGQPSSGQEKEGGRRKRRVQVRRMRK